MDAGLLMGLAEGIKTGTASYQDARKNRIAEDQALEDRKARLNREAKEDKYRESDIDLKNRAFEQNRLEEQNRNVRELSEKGYEAQFDTENKGLLRGAKKIPGWKKEVDPIQGLLMQERLDKAVADREKRAKEATPEGRLAGLTADQRGRLDNSRMGLDAVRSMSNALIGEGQNTSRLPFTGDNDYTAASKAFEEALGRMQSGGAIGVEEAKRFREMAPTMFDSAEIQKKKLAKLEQELGARMHTLGFKEEDLGKAGYSITKLSDKTRKKLGLMGPAEPQDPQIAAFAESQGVDYNTAANVIAERKLKASAKVPAAKPGVKNGG